MGTSLRYLCLAGVLSLPTFAEIDAQLRSRVEATSYPPLPRQARIQGDVKLKITGNTVSVVSSGHQILGYAAIEDWRRLGFSTPSDLAVTYHFVIVEDHPYRVEEKIVPRSSALGRLLLRLLNKPTTTIEQHEVCKEDLRPQPNRIESSGDRVDIWIYTGSVCVTVQYD